MHERKVPGSAPSAPTEATAEGLGRVKSRLKRRAPRRRKKKVKNAPVVKETKEKRTTRGLDQDNFIY